MKLNFRKFVKKIRSRKYSVNFQSGDYFLASYPRSGNTWMRFLLANLLSEDDLEIDFHNLHEYVPELGRNNDIINSLEGLRIIKTHRIYSECPARAVYLIRDGRDVYVSYYHYRLPQLSPGTTFSDFLRREDHFPCLWKDHIISWQRCPDDQILFIHYEDMIRDTAEELKKVVKFCGMQLDQHRINRAVMQSRFERMKKIDQEKGRKYNLTGTKSFVRKGKPGNWREWFSEADKEFFKERAGEMLIMLGYEDDYHW